MYWIKPSKTLLMLVLQLSEAYVRVPIPQGYHKGRYDFINFCVVRLGRIERWCAVAVTDRGRQPPEVLMLRQLLASNCHVVAHR